MKLFCLSLILPLDEDVISNIEYEIYYLKKLLIGFIFIHIIFGVTNILITQERLLLGIFEITCIGIFGLIIFYSKILILFVLYSLISIISCSIHFDYVTFKEFTFSDIINIICISEIINSICCSIISTRIFLIAINYINWAYLIESLNRDNFPVAYVDYPRINNNSSYIGYFTPYQDRSNNFRNNEFIRESSDNCKEINESSSLNDKKNKVCTTYTVFEGPYNIL